MLQFVILVNLAYRKADFKIVHSLTVRGPSTSGHNEGSARSPLPLKADYKTKQFTINNCQVELCPNNKMQAIYALTLSYRGNFIFIPAHLKLIFTISEIFISKK